MSDVILRPFQWRDIPAITAIYRHYVENTAITFDTEAPGEPAMAEKFGFRHVGRYEAVGFKFDHWHDIVHLQLAL